MIALLDNPTRLGRRSMKKRYSALSIGILAAAGIAAVSSAAYGEAIQLEAISIIGGTEEDLLRAPGSAHVIDREELEKFEYTDIHRVLQSVPGVYIREEDGYGLRPNIGIRGATSERSSKVTLLEDGLLLAPAPYAAPAAYYFPVVTRMTSVEVYKGPVSIKHGPYTVGGAINLISRPIPADTSGGVDVAVGQDDFRKLHGYYGDSGENFGWLLDGIHLESDGFKELDGGGDTGFDKNDLMFKARVNSDPGATLYQELNLKLGYAEEDSNETYLGLTDEDFEATPYRRYAASQLDRFEHDRQQYELSYYLAPGANYDLTTTLYRHDFERVWSKLNGFDTDTSLNDILSDPDSSLNEIFLDVLRGERDSLSDPETLLIGTNDREYYSQGIQTVGHWRPMLGDVEHEVEIGVRYHEDEIERFQTEDGFLMSGGNLIPDGGETEVIDDNTGSAEALALYAHDEFTLGKFTLSGGLRTELIDTELVTRDPETGETTGTIDDSTDVVIPGAGIFYEVTPSFGLLAGVHKGFVPNGPGEGEDAGPEESVNYEAGLRYAKETARAEIIGFYSDYSNLLGRCTISVGCDIDQVDEEFDGGEVDILGAEALFGYEFKAAGFRFPMSLAYTYTNAEFQNSFASDFRQFGGADGIVNEGDKLPYLPPHQATVRFGIASDNWQADVSGTYVDEMRDTASQGDAPNVDPGDEDFFLLTDEQFVVDLTGSYNVTRNGQVYVQLNNVFDAADIVSYQPFGARPGSPRQISLGYEYDF